MPDEGTGLLPHRRRAARPLAVTASVLVATIGFASLRGAALADRSRVDASTGAQLESVHSDDDAVSPADALSIASFSCGYPAMQLVCTAHFKVAPTKIGDA